VLPVTAIKVSLSLSEQKANQNRERNPKRKPYPFLGKMEMLHEAKGCDKGRKPAAPAECSNPKTLKQIDVRP
jgi:hypothetical protein